jgi:hypothetical protein
VRSEQNLQIPFPSLVGTTVIVKQVVLLTQIHRGPAPSQSKLLQWPTAGCSSLQRRDRAGLSPASLLSPNGHLFHM